jgi:drug/metabolite transporter (DMT)-like permease
MIITRTMGPTQWAMLLALGLIWGGSFYFNAVAVRHLPTLTIVWVRVALASLALWAVVGALGLARPQGLAQWRDLAVMGLLNNVVPFSLIVWGQREIASGLASILNATMPFFTLLFAHVLTRDEPLSGMRLAGIVTGIAGVSLMIGLDALSGLGGQIAGQIAVLAAAATYGLAGVFGRSLAIHPPLVTAAGQTLASGLALAPLVLVLDRPWGIALPPADGLFAVIGLALLCTALAYVLYFAILRSAGAGNVSLVTFLVPVSAIFLGMWRLGETLGPRHLFGLLVIAAGLVLIDGRLVARLRQRAPGRGGRPPAGDRQPGGTPPPHPASTHGRRR